MFRYKTKTVLTMSQKLYLMEFLISKIKVDAATVSIPTYDNIKLQIRCAQFLYVDIVTDEFSVEGLDAGMKPANGEFLVKIGKTYLFSFNANALADELQSFPMIIDLLVVRQTEGTGKFNWPQTFIDLSTQSTGSINQDIILDLFDVNNRKIGSLDLNIKFSCIGNSLETNFTLQNRQAQFVNPVTKAQFKLERFELPEAGAVYGKEVAHSDSKISWFELYGGKGGGSKISTVPMIPLDDIGFHQSYGKKPADGVSHQSGWDIVSIVFRPPENKFFDFLQILSVEVDENQSEKMKNLTTTFEEEVDLYKSSIHNTDDTNTELNTDLINKYICKNKNCPVAQKFKDYGVGSLAVVQGMGTLYKNVTNNKCYGLSNTYGVFTNYGPYGVFKKNPDYPFFPPRVDENILEDEDDDQPITIKPCPPCPNEKENTCQCCGKFCRLRGGGILNKNSFGRSLRLRGGGLSANVDTLFYLASQPSENMLFCDGCSLLHANRLRGGGGASEERPAGLKSAMIECKPVMDQFDEILQNYRNALGPCGTATCPFSQNMVERICKQVCYLDPKDQCTCSPTAECQNNPCTLEKCPYKEKQNAKYPAGCGSPKCAYAQHKLGLVDDDAAMELALLPPPMIGNCGHPKCDYPSANLPPIHWDCPDPLPQDVCKNPNCPHQPKELADIKVKNKKTPCCSQNCPYALPPPCDLPSCPFRQKPCPYLSKKKEGDKNPCCDIESSEEEEDDEVCANPACPFAKKTDGSEGCSNPLCPYGKKKNPKKKKAQECCECNEQPDPEEEFCDSPECPMNLKKKSINKSSTDDNCNNPSCPAKSSKGNKDDACDKPSCPFAKDKNSQKEELCDNPKCPYKSKANDGDIGCSSPECPFTKNKKNTSQVSLESESLCDNPECPFRSGGPGLSKENKDQVCDDCDKSVCSNPDCPHNKLNSEESKLKPKDYCDNPQCPFSKEFQENVCIDPFCPYSQPLPSCGIPNCPYEQKPQLFCPSPICPSKFNSVQPQQTATIEPKPRKVSNAGDASSEGRRGSGKRGSASSQNKKPQTPTKEVIYKENENSSNKKQKSRFVYSVGDQYPGVKIGHRECKVPRFLVPAKMGWLWCVPPPWPMWKFPRKGWRPGAIEKSIAARIKAHRESKGLGMLMLPDFGKGGKKRRGGGESDDDLNIKPKPTLHITKKDGAYLITMNPLKDPFSLAENEDPYMECTPMQFKITKNKQDDADALCQCNDDAKSSSSDSELDIEFTPPAGIIHPDRFKKKRNVIHCESQYNPADFADKKAAKKDKGDKGTKKAKSEKGGKKGKKK